MPTIKHINIKYSVHQWDWKEQPNWDEIVKITEEIGQPVFFHEINTQSDSYAVLIANQRLNKEQAKKLFIDYNNE